MPGWNCTRALVAQSWSGVFFRGIVWDLLCVYQPPAMQFGAESFWVITSIYLCCSVIRTVMELSSKTTLPLTSPGWILAVWMSIPLTFLSYISHLEAQI